MSRLTPKEHRSANLNGIDLSKLEPHGDLVLVRKLPPDEEWHGVALAAGATDTHRMMSPIGYAERGVVVRVGPGDPMYCYRCLNCGALNFMIGNAVPYECANCNCNSFSFTLLHPQTSTGEHIYCSAPMNVSIGDEVLYTRSPANDVDIDNVPHVFLHEESQILAVVERNPSVFVSAEIVEALKTASADFFRPEGHSQQEVIEAFTRRPNGNS
jgi:hypothetical protein